MKTVGKVLVVIVMVAALGGMGYLLAAPPKDAAGQESAVQLPTAKVARGSVVKQITGPGEAKAAVVEKVKMAKWRYFKAFVAPLNKRIPAGTPLVEYTYGDPLLAPYDLVVLSKNLPKEKEELTDEHYVEVARVDALHVEFEAHESDVAKLAEGQPAEVSFGSDESAPLAGTVVNINQVGAYNATGSRYKVTVEIPNDGSLLLGMSATVRIEVARADDVLTVPVSTVTSAADGTSLVLVQRPDGTIEPVTVETGLSDGSVVEIKSGLAEGDLVALNEASDSDSSESAVAGGVAVMSVG